MRKTIKASWPQGESVKVRSGTRHVQIGVGADVRMLTPTAAERLADAIRDCAQQTRDDS